MKKMVVYRKKLGNGDEFRVVPVTWAEVGLIGPGSGGSAGYSYEVKEAGKKNWRSLGRREKIEDAIKAVETVIANAVRVYGRDTIMKPRTSSRKPKKETGIIRLELVEF